MSQPGSGRATPQAQGQPGASSAYAYQAAQPTSASSKRPALAGAKTTQRKGVAKAQAKFEPTVFRDDLIRGLSSVPKDDYDGYSRALETLANELEFKKYEAQLFELLILGRLLAPGGNLSTEGEECPLSVLGRDASDIKEILGVFSKLIRRYKYLQRPLEEASLPSILQNSNKLDKATPHAASTLAVPGTDGNDATPAEGASISGTSTPVSGSRAPMSVSNHPRPSVEKLAAFTAVMIGADQVSPTHVFSSMKRDHLVKDGTSLAFITAFLRSFTGPAASGSGAGETVDALASILRKTGCTDLLEFFPLQRRSVTELTKEFKEKKVDGKVIDWYLKIVEGWKKEEILRKLKELTEDAGQGRAGNEELIVFLQTEAKPSTSMPEGDFIALVWQGLMINFGAMTEEKTDQEVNEILLRWVKEIIPVLAKFTVGARSEIALINAIQVFIYNHSKLLSQFPRIVQVLYNDDVLSSQAIFYWYEKGAKSQGKQSMLKAMEPLVKAIKQSEESDEDDDE